MLCKSPVLSGSGLQFKKKVVAMQFVDQTWKHAAMRVHSKLCLLLTEIVSFARKTNL